MPICELGLELKIMAPKWDERIGILPENRTESMWKKKFIASKWEESKGVIWTLRKKKDQAPSVTSGV